MNTIWKVCAKPAKNLTFYKNFGIILLEKMIKKCENLGPQKIKVIAWFSYLYVGARNKDCISPIQIYTGVWGFHDLLLPRSKTTLFRNPAEVRALLGLRLGDRKVMNDAKSKTI